MFSAPLSPERRCYPLVLRSLAFGAYRLRSVGAVELLRREAHSRSLSRRGVARAPNADQSRTALGPEHQKTAAGESGRRRAQRRSVFRSQRPFAACEGRWTGERGFTACCPATDDTRAQIRGRERQSRPGCGQQSSLCPLQGAESPGLHRQNGQPGGDNQWSAARSERRFSEWAETDCRLREEGGIQQSDGAAERESVDHTKCRRDRLSEAELHQRTCC